MANEKRIWGVFNGETRETWHVTEEEAGAKMKERIAHYEGLAKGSDFPGIRVPDYRVSPGPAFPEANRLWIGRLSTHRNLGTENPLDTQADEQESHFDLSDPHTFVLEEREGSTARQDGDH